MRKYYPKIHLNYISMQKALPRTPIKSELNQPVILDRLRIKNVYLILHFLTNDLPVFTTIGSLDDVFKWCCRPYVNLYCAHKAAGLNI